MAIGVPAASAATEIGDTCTGNEATEGPPAPTIAEISAAGNPMPTAVPGPGVITKWRVSVVPTTLGFPQSLKVLRVDSTAHTALLVAEDARSLSGGINTFESRIPVQAGDRIGLYGPSPIGTLYCDGSDKSLLLAYAGGGSVGSSTAFTEVETEGRIPLVATVEPDVDKDGYGDETQDKCPQSAAVQVECPVVILDAIPVSGKGAITVYVSTSTSVAVSVAGTAALPKAPKAKAGSSAKVKLKAAAQTVPPGKLARFKLKLPAALKSSLATLPAGKSITVKVTASAANVAGAVSTDSAKVKLK